MAPQAANAGVETSADCFYINYFFLEFLSTLGINLNFLPSPKCFLILASSLLNVLTACGVLHGIL